MSELEYPLYLVADDRWIPLQPTMASFEEAFQAANTAKEHFIWHNGVKYPWSCGLCPRAIMRMLFPESTTCKPSDCVKLWERIINEDTNSS